MNVALLYFLHNSGFPRLYIQRSVQEHNEDNEARWKELW